jgi:hypothetical protein
MSLVFPIIGGAISIYFLVGWFCVHTLKRRVKDWSSNKRNAFLFGMPGRSSTVILFGSPYTHYPRSSPLTRPELWNLTEEDRSLIKLRMARPGEIISDEEVDLFWSMHCQLVIWVPIFWIVFVGLAAALWKW